MKRTIPLLLCLCNPSWATFTARQNGVRGDCPSTSTCTSGAFPGTPTVGDLLVCGVTTFTSSASCGTVNSVQIGTGNTFTVSTHSPSNNNPAADGCAFGYYILSAGVVGSSVTVNMSASISHITFFCDDVAVTGGAVSLDSDIAGHEASAGTNINTPTIAVAGSNEYLYCAVAGGDTSVTSANAPWTGNFQGQISGNYAEYDLSASANTHCDFTQSSAGWDSLGIAFKQPAVVSGSSTSGLLLKGSKMNIQGSKVTVR
jgi:hypothetical protein